MVAGGEEQLFGLTALQGGEGCGWLQARVHLDTSNATKKVGTAGWELC